MYLIGFFYRQEKNNQFDIERKYASPDWQEQFWEVRGMPMYWKYVNPVNITFGEGALGSLKEKLAGRRYCLVTYSDNPYFDELTEAVACSASAPSAIVRDVEPNPSFNGLRGNCAEFGRASSTPEVIVALGGGSVIDTAKVLAASGKDFSRVQAFLEGRAGPETLGRLPIIAIPTTSGTGSEVTSWATVWDTDAKKKYSLARPELYPEHAILDPSLTLRVPRGLTLSTGLDALSHALESIWNVNANPVSANHAVYAATEVLEALPALVDHLDDLGLRTRIARASLSAGLAFSNTKTALAHSLSYYLTLHHGTVHGIACSFSLPAVMRSVIGHDPTCDAVLERIFGPDLRAGADRLEGLLKSLGVSTRATDYGVTTEDWRGAIEDALVGERGRNFIGSHEAVLTEAA
ncbi:iron-containing alcohol dehydrogenase PsrA [Methylobacterium sp. J-070]|uniref:iron-containing alcohol dehydrogenase PsrA n=1 Tax=Methylobacterium sp. J-070 TaxID=2836650 RepID=UPI001FB996D6|nr:iron-containing alcohol dehydrogenase PsrA [Methylobacterium sp. J-070]MCJ2048457.1 phosphonoacetaldehyde reductase [Methylobacterium sp. J-070]